MKILVAGNGTLTWNGRTVRCALGRSGITGAKREGDGATPAGSFALLRILYRPDRINAPQTRLPVAPMAQGDGWCDDAAHPAYNQPVALPFAASHEKMWREDGLYDVVGILDYNLAPARPGLGSAIFLHVAREGHAPTAGCVALALPDLLALIADCAPGDILEITP